VPEEKPREKCRTEAKSTLIIIGTILSQIRTAMGILIWLAVPNSRFRNNGTRCGAHFTNATPATMQRPTQMVRYFLNRLSRLTGGLPDMSVRTASMDLSPVRGVCLTYQVLLIKRAQKITDMVRRNGARAVTPATRPQTTPTL